MASPPVDEILEIVRTASNAVEGCDRLLALCAEKSPSRLWSKFDAIDPIGDVESARVWLRDQWKAVGKFLPIRGVYLGLDPLNMDEGQGTNIELGVSDVCDPESHDPDWLGRCEWYGENHLIAGLFTMKKIYGQKRWESLNDFAEYSLFLGYGGLVLADAFSTPDLTGLGKPFLAAWGFHDGDIFTLGRGDGQNFTRLASLWEPDDPVEDERPQQWAGLRIWQPPD